MSDDRARAGGAGAAPGVDRLDGLLSHAWARLTAAADRAEGAMRTATLATVAAAGGAEARTVVLRHADREAATVAVYTHGASGKLNDIRHDPRGTILGWDAPHLLQVRLAVTLAATPGGACDWHALTPDQRLSYARDPRPGAPIGGPRPRTGPDPALFVRLTATVRRIDVVHLGDDLHRRAVYDAADGWAGRWVGP